MQMKILVCVKQIQDPEIAPGLFKVDEASNSVVAVPGIAQVISPYDEQAIEAALRIKEKTPEAKVVVITLGAASARDVLKHGLSMGADEAVLVEGPKNGSADGFVTASVLSEAIKKLAPFDLILTGRQSADLDAGVVACGLAELLGIPSVNFAKSVDVSDGNVVVDRVLDNGFEKIQVQLPALVTVSNEMGPARKPNLRETMKASRKPMQSWPQNDVNKDAGASQELIRLYVPIKEKHCEIIGGTSAGETAQMLVRKLRDGRLI